MKVSIQVTEDKTVLEYLREHHIHMSAPCGGKGTCGKCKVKVKGHAVPIDEAERKLLGEQQVERGYRLACKIPCEEGLQVEIVDQEENFYVETSYEGEVVKLDGHLGKENTNDYGIAIDIGTTTLALELIELSQGKTVEIYTSLNSGRRYGADVISRIDYATQHGAKELQAVMREDLMRGIESLCHKHTLQYDQIKQIVVAGNTTMLHLLMGANCQGLGVYPFIPEFIDKVEISVAELLGREELSGRATLLPGISTYVGADIVSGILKCKMHEKDTVTMLIDIGTNGEMVIGNKDKLLSLATAAGPAFEGGNMSCGTGSIKGAICEAIYEEDNFKLKTIGDAAPVGICGSGLIDLVAESLKHEMMDETGLIEEDDAIEVVEGIVLTQEDIRHFQLAKAAIRAGIEILMDNYGVKGEAVGEVYLAGGFGKFINLANAYEIGLLPQVFQDKVKRVGNTSLGGAKSYLLEQNRANEVSGIAHIKAISHDLNLANDPQFNAYFVEYMMFGEE